MRTTTVVIGAGHGGLAMSRCLVRPLDRPRGARAGRGRQLVADRAMGLAPPAHAELAVPAPRLRLRRRRPRRVHDDARGRRLHHRLREGHRRAGADRHDGDVGAPRPTTATASRPTRASGSARPSCSPPARSTCRACPSFAEAVPASVTTLTPMDYRNPGELADGGVLVVGASATGRADRPRDPALGPSGHAGRRRARAGPARLPGPRHPLVDGGGRRARRALRRGGRHRAGAPRAVDAARRIARARHVRPQRAHRHRRAAGRPPRRHPRRPRPVLRVVAEQVRPRRPQARPAARHHRRVGDGQRHGRRDTAAAPVRTDGRARAADARPRSHQRGDPDRSSGRPASGPTTPGSTSTCSTPRGWSATTVASSSRPGCT